MKRSGSNQVEEHISELHNGWQSIRCSRIFALLLLLLLSTSSSASLASASAAAAASASLLGVYPFHFDHDLMHVCNMYPCLDVLRRKGEDIYAHTHTHSYISASKWMCDTPNTYPLLYTIKSKGISYCVDIVTSSK